MMSYNNLAALLKPKPTPPPRSFAQQVQTKLFQQSGQLARLKSNAKAFAFELYGQEALVAQQFIEIVLHAERQNRDAMKSIPKQIKRK
jgi:hypothetical protein